MTDIERLEDRLTAVERAVVDGDHDFDDLTDLAAVIDSVERIDDRLGELEERVATLEARADSVEGYVANVDSINEDVEKQAASAMASVESLEERLDSLTAEDDAAAETERERGREDRIDPPAPGSQSSTEAVVVDDEFTASVDDLVAGTERELTLGQPDTNGTGSAGGATASPSAGDATGSNTLRSNGASPPNDESPSGPQSRAATRNVDDGNATASGSPPSADPETIRDRFGSPAEVASDTPEADEDEDDGGFLASLKASLS